MQIARPYRIALFGHRDFGEHRLLEKYFPPLLKELIRKESFVEIYIGRNGEFDLYAASLVKRVQKETGKESSELICVLPYPQKDEEYYENYYDCIMIPECLIKAHPKGAITKRNRWIVEQADLLICYVERENGGAYNALKYARQLGKQIVNFAESRWSEDEPLS